MADSNIFDQILQEAKDRGFQDTRTNEARRWLRDRASEVSEVSEQALVVNREHLLTAVPVIGGLYVFKYDPKTKDKLPYYDEFPVVIPIEFTSDGFKGLNLHYLPHVHRAVLMDRMYAFVTDPSLSDNAKIALSYSALTVLTNYASFRPCFKRYLFGYCQSKFLKIKPLEWEIALFLPLERFRKASATRIYNDSLGKIRERKRRKLL